MELSAYTVVRDPPLLASDLFSATRLLRAGCSERRLTTYADQLRGTKPVLSGRLAIGICEMAEPLAPAGRFPAVTSIDVVYGDRGMRPSLSTLTRQLLASLAGDECQHRPNDRRLA